MTTTTSGTGRRAGAVALVAAPALALVLDRLDAWLLPDDLGHENEGIVARLGRIRAHDLLWQADAVLAMAAGLLVIAGALCLVGLTRPGAPHLSRVTGLALVPAGAGLFAHGVFYNVVYGAMSRVPEAATMAPFHDAMEAYPPFWVALVVVIAGTVFGLLLAAFALWRSQVVPVWAAALAAVNPLVQLVSLDGWWSFAGTGCWLASWAVVARVAWRSASAGPVVREPATRTVAG